MTNSRERSTRTIRLAVQLVGAAIALAACNYPGWQDTARVPPTEVIAAAPTPTLECIEGMTALSESGYLDAMHAEPATTVERIWHVRNSGTCAWTTAYTLVRVEGDSFGHEPVPLATPVDPGEETDLRLSLRAPSDPGLYAGGWALQSPAGAHLGAASRPLRVRVNVGSVPGEPTTEVYNFATQMCDARWVAASPTRSGRLLPCPGYDRDQGGSIIRDDAPRFSTGAQDDEPALILHPPYEEGGLISGTFPSYTVQAGDQFRVIIGCGAGAPGCSARFQLNVREGEQLLPVAEWLVTDATPPRNLVIDLTFLAGQTVGFVLGVDADGPGAADAAIWLQPRIVH